MTTEAGIDLTLDEVSIAQLRNLEQVCIRPADRLNVITGKNGQGKTSVLEAIYLLATSCSFRCSRLAEMVRHEQRIASVRGRFSEHWSSGPVRREQSLGLDRGRRTAKLDGEAPESLSHYATRSPVVVFDPQQMTLSTGPASERRTLLDRLTLFTQPEVAGHRARYRRALRERQKLLSDRVGRLGDAPELDAYETLLAEHGAAITRARSQACGQLSHELTIAFESIAAPGLALDAGYLQAGSEDDEQVRQALRDARISDARSKRTSFGPHRDDLALTLDGHPARVVASQGQHRAITLALKVAEQACIGQARGVRPILLLDDVSSELDADRTAALFRHLATTRSQIFLTTTRRDLIVTSQTETNSRQDFFISEGKLSENPS